MSTKAYKEKSRQWIGVEAQPCLGVCGNDYEAAYARIANAHPEWTRVRREQRALVEMLKRENQR